MPSYLIDSPEETLVSGSIHILTGAEHHHLSTVTRHQIGDEILLNNSNGWLGSAKILQIEKKQSTLEILKRHEVQRGADYAIAFSLLKSQNDELLVEKCTELGVTELFPFTSKYTIRKANEAVTQRFLKLALAAIKQCNNPFLPFIHGVSGLRECLELIRFRGYSPVVCSERKPDLWLDSLSGRNDKPCFFIGPEGGWSDDEFNLFSREHIPEICFCPLITRAETAAIAVASQYQLSTRKTIAQ